MKLTFLFFLILILIFAKGACLSKEMVDPVDVSPVFSGPSKERKGITSIIKLNVVKRIISILMRQIDESLIIKIQGLLQEDGWHV